MSSARYRTKAELYFHCTGILARGRRVIGGKAGGPDHAGVTASYAMRRAPRDWYLNAQNLAEFLCAVADDPSHVPFAFRWLSADADADSRIAFSRSVGVVDSRARLDSLTGPFLFR